MGERKKGIFLFLILFVSFLIINPIYFYFNLPKEDSKIINNPNVNTKEYGECTCENMSSILNEYTNHSYSLNQSELDNLIKSNQNFSDYIKFANELGFTKCLGKYRINLVRNQNISFFFGVRSALDENNCSVIGIVYIVPEWNMNISPPDSSNIGKILLLAVNNTTFSVFDRTWGLRFNNLDLINRNITNFEAWGNYHHSCDWSVCFVWCIISFILVPGLSTLCYALGYVCIDTINPYACAAFVTCLVIGVLICVFTCLFNPCAFGYNPPDSEPGVSLSSAKEGETIVILMMFFLRILS